MSRMQKLVVIGLGITLSACSFFKGSDDYDLKEFKGMTAKQLYTSAETSLNKHQYTDATKRFEAMESMYPFSSYTERAQLKLVYAYYQNEQFPAAAATAERFIH